ncbi:hypothetical protein [Saliphagus infecundisoli]|nr:hypothetical protein [Saliphagus infecundisoli]
MNNRLATLVRDAQIPTLESRSSVRAAMTVLVVTVALSLFSGVVAAAPASSEQFVYPLQMGEEICATPAGDFMELAVWVAIFMFFGVIVTAIFLGGAIEALPVSGWWMQTGYSMMGRIPIAVGFVLFGISVLVLAVGVGSLNVPSCIPILG